MMLADELDRATVKLVVMHDTPAWREYHERVLKRAGYGDVTTCPTDPESLSNYLSNGGSGRADLVLFGVEPKKGNSWERLRDVRDLFDGPVLVTTETHDDAVRSRAGSIGIHEYFSVGDSEEEGLELKVETAITAFRINTMIEDNDHRTQRMFVNILTVMVKILESKDHYTRFHSHSVALWSRMLGRKKGLSEEELIRLGLAAVFHDFGKIGIPEEVLNKPARLTDEEFAIMKQHPTIARDLLSSLDQYSDLLPAITHHHERWDGTGYPDGLRGEQIPLWARIIALADAYDTMATRRTYKEPMPPSEVISEIKGGRGSQFDPELVDLMLETLAEKEGERSK